MSHPLRMVPRKRAAAVAALVVVLTAPSVLADPPLNDTPEGGAPVVLPFHETEQDTRQATRDPELAFGCASLGYSDKTVWFRYVATTPVPVRMSTEGSNYDTVLDAWTQEADGTFTRVACDDDWLEHSEFVLEPTVGTIYYVQAGGYSPAWGQPTEGGDLVFSITPVGT